MPTLNIPPAYLLVLLLALLCAALFHLWRGRRWSDLLVALLAALVGLSLGQIIGPRLGIEFLRIGQVYVLVGVIFAWALMLAASWLKG